ncbi:jg9690 [Pararge aegeria aegeria]|uniref:Jg9690 protein n=1 Tax=Pararge aegeria aegeria TaxID=348720 RepID=A0A8S4RUT3_9NEOP|nr:jg9690 [Pararge aegeria aegeria]
MIGNGRHFRSRKTATLYRCSQSAKSRSQLNKLYFNVSKADASVGPPAVPAEGPAAAACHGRRDVGSHVETDLESYAAYGTAPTLGGEVGRGAL